MYTYKLTLLFFLMIITGRVNAQERKAFKIHTIAFYNLENLFDVEDDPMRLDEFSPIMELKSNRKTIYNKKVHHMARVIADIGFDTTKNTPIVVGVCEVENRKVLEDLVSDSLLIKKDYGIVHYDSPDARGIDVALLYQKQLFTPTSTSVHTLKIYNNKSQKRMYTRDQLLVSGALEGETVHFIINHWPSRRGGEQRSNYKRIAAAKLNKRLLDSLQTIDPYAKVVIMGDLNDNPNNTSLKDVLKTKQNRKKVGLKGLYNPFENFYKEGFGTTAYRDSWSLFDQILVTNPLLSKDYSSYRFYKAGIFNKNYLITKQGNYKGYPLRSWANGTFNTGFSDHFPVYTYIIKAIKLP